MSQVRVWNDNVYNYFEKYKGKPVTIPAKQFIMMEEGEAHQFLSTFNDIQIDKDGNPSPQGYKMLRIERSDDDGHFEIDEEKNVCNSCGFKAASEVSLNEHVNKNHAHLLVTDEEAEKEIVRRRGRPKKTV